MTREVGAGGAVSSPRAPISFSAKAGGPPPAACFVVRRNSPITRARRDRPTFSFRRECVYSGNIATAVRTTAGVLREILPPFRLRLKAQVVEAQRVEANQHPWPSCCLNSVRRWPLPAPASPFFSLARRSNATQQEGLHADRASDRRRHHRHS